MISIGAMFELSNNFARKLYSRANEYSEAAKTANNPDSASMLNNMSNRAYSQQGRIFNKDTIKTLNTFMNKKDPYIKTIKDENQDLKNLYNKSTNKIYPERTK
jgi:hypothetical protein